MSIPAARRYAKALYMIGVEDNSLDAITRDLHAVAETVRSSKELHELLANPVIAQTDRRAVMAEIVSRLGLGATTRNAVMMLTDRRRGALIPEIAEALAQLSDERQGRLHAEVTSAVALTEAQASRLTASLEKLTGKKISLKRKVDPSLIGGVVTRVGDKLYDGSVRTRLEEIRQQALQA